MMVDGEQASREEGAALSCSFHKASSHDEANVLDT